MKMLITVIAAAALAGCVGYVPYGGPAYYGNGGAYDGNGGAYDGNGGPYVVAPVPEARWGDGGHRRWRGHGDGERDRDQDRDGRDFQRRY